MGQWECKDGTMVDMIFDDKGDFVKFGDNVTKENAEKAKAEIMEANRRQMNHFKLVDMIENGMEFEDITGKCGENMCVDEYKLQVPVWCHEDADCHDCWVRCLNKYFGK